MMKIHHIEGRRSERVAWLMEELGQPYELVFKRGEVRGSFMDLAKQHAMHMAPTVEDDGIKLVESGAILDYILRKHGAGGLVPPVSSPDYQRYVEYMHFAEGSAMPRISPALQSLMAGKPMRERDKDQYENLMAFIEGEIASRPYFAGESFTPADIMMEFPLKLVPRLGDGLKPYPHVAAWLKRVHARPAYQRMIAKALPDGVVPAA